MDEGWFGQAGRIRKYGQRSDSGATAGTASASVVAGVGVLSTWAAHTRGGRG